MERSEELRDFALLYCQAITSGDMGFLERRLSRRDGLVLIGAGSREWWAGDAAAVKAYAAQTWGNAGCVQMAAGDPQAYREGSVGWVADLVKIRLPDATEIPCRLTMVWHQDNGQWKIVQLHLSAGVEWATAARRPETPQESMIHYLHKTYARRSKCCEGFRPLC